MARVKSRPTGQTTITRQRTQQSESPYMSQGDELTNASLVHIPVNVGYPVAETPDADAQAIQKRLSDDEMAEYKSTTPQFSPRYTDTWNMGQWYLGRVTNDDPLLQTQFTKAGYGYQTPYGIYEEALDKDEHLAACVETRRASVYNRPWVIEPADDSDEAFQAADFVRQALQGIGEGRNDNGFTEDLSQLLNAVYMGVGFSEVTWKETTLKLSKKPDGNKRAYDVTVPDCIYSRDPRRFTFDIDGNPRLLVIQNQWVGVPVPDRRLIVFRPYARYEGFYGLPAARRVWWSVWFKRELNIMMLRYAEAFGSPLRVVEESRELTIDERAVLKAALTNLVGTTAMAMPFMTKVRFEEVGGTGNDIYHMLLDYYNAQISKGILGQAMTIENTGAGARSMGEVGERATQAIVNQDARALEGIVNGTLIEWLMELNFPDMPKPRFVIKTQTTDDQAKRAVVYQAAVNAGLSVSAKAMADELEIVLAQNDEDDVQAQVQKRKLAEVSAGSVLDTRPGGDIAANPKNPGGNSNPGGSPPSAKTAAKSAANRQDKTGR